MKTIARLPNVLLKFSVGILLTASLVITVVVSPVLAHGVIEKSEPAAGAAVAASPPRVVIWFTESIEPRFSSIEVYSIDSSQRVDLGDVRINADRSLVVSLRPNLPHGAYRVVWRIFTPSDGHTANGQYAFGVGVPVFDAQMITNSGESGLLNDTIRFLSIIGQAMFMGIAVFRWAIRLEDDRRFDRATFWVVQFIRIALGVGWMGTLFVQWQSIDASVLDVLSTRWGAIWLMRSAVLSVVLFKINSLLRGDEKSGALLSGAFLLFTFSLISHSAAKFGLGGAAIDSLHLLATSIWSGGVICALIAVFNGERKFLANFSILAIASVGLFVASGLWLSSEQVTTWGALLFTQYGRALLIKLAAVAAVFGLGLINTFSPRKNFLIIESGVALIILFVAAALTNLPPAFSQISDNAPTRIELGKTTSALNVSLALSPARLGTNTVQVRLRDVTDKPINKAQVILTFQPLTRGLVSELTLNEIGQGVYVGAGANLIAEGEWQILIAVNERDYVSLDVKVAPDLSVRPLSAPLEVSVQVISWLNQYAVIVAALLLLLGAAIWSWIAWRSLPRTQLTLVIYLVPGLLVAGALWLWIKLNF